MSRALEEIERLLSEFSKVIGVGRGELAAFLKVLSKAESFSSVSFKIGLLDVNFYVDTGGRVLMRVTSHEEGVKIRREYDLTFLRLVPQRTDEAE